MSLDGPPPQRNAVAHLDDDVVSLSPLLRWNMMHTGNTAVYTFRLRQENLVNVFKKLQRVHEDGLDLSNSSWHMLVLALQEHLVQSHKLLQEVEFGLEASAKQWHGFMLQSTEQLTWSRCRSLK